MHTIDETSPLFGYTPERLASEWVEIVALVSGLDETMMQNVHARASYDGSAIQFGHRFADLFGYLGDGTRVMDYRQFHETEPEASLSNKPEASLANEPEASLVNKPEASVVTKPKAGLEIEPESER
jgi:hypothetical protein